MKEVIPVFKACKGPAFSSEPVTIRDKCVEAVKNLDLPIIQALYVTERLIEFYNVDRLRFNERERGSLFAPVIERIKVQTRNYCSVVDYSEVEKFEDEVYRSVKDRLLQAASKEADAKICANLVKFVCFMEVPKNKSRRGSIVVSNILSQVRSGKDPGDLFTALFSLWNSEVGKYLCLSALDYRKTVKEMSAHRLSVAGILKHGVELMRSAVQGFNFQDLLTLYLRDITKLSEEDLIELVVYVAVYGAVRARQTDLRYCLKSLFSGRDFVDMIDAVQSVMKMMKTKIQVPVRDGDEHTSALKEAIENSVKITLKEVEVGKLDISQIESENGGRIVCLAAFKGVLENKVRLKISPSVWSRLKGFVGIGGKNDNVVLPPLSLVVKNFWENGMKGEVVPLAVKILELYQKYQELHSSGTDFNTGMFSFILNSQLARVEIRSLGNCSVTFRQVLSQNLGSQVATILKAIETVEPPLLDSLFLLLFHIWKLYCEATARSYKSLFLDRDTVEDICQSVECKQGSSVLRCAMAAALIGNVFNNLLEASGNFWCVPEAALFVARLNSLFPRLKNLPECKRYFTFYEKTKQVIDGWIRKTKTDEIDMQDKDLYDTNRSKVNDVVGALLPVGDASNFERYMHNVNFDKQIGGLRSSLEVLKQLHCLVGRQKFILLRNDIEENLNRIDGRTEYKTTLKPLMVLEERFDSELQPLQNKKLNENFTLKDFAAHFFVEKSKLFLGYRQFFQRGRAVLSWSDEVIEFLLAIHQHLVNLLQATEATETLTAVFEELNRKNTEFEVGEELAVLNKFPPYESLAKEDLLDTITSAVDIVHYIQMLPEVLETLDAYKAVAGEDDLYQDLKSLERRRKEICSGPLSGVISSDVARVKHELDVVPIQYWKITRGAQNFIRLQTFLRKYPTAYDFDTRLNYVTTRLRTDSPDHALLNSVILAHQYLFPLMKKQKLCEILEEVKNYQMSFQSAMEHLETVNKNIEQVELLFNEATTESARQRAKNLSKLHIHLQNLSGNCTTFSLLGYKELSLNDQMSETTHEPITCSELETYDLRRWLVFDTAEQDRDNSVQQFQCKLDIVYELFEELKKLEADGHPGFQDRDYEVSLTVDDLANARMECDMHKKAWRDVITSLRQKNRLYHLLSGTQIMAMLTIFTKSMNFRPTLLRKLTGQVTEVVYEQTVSARLFAGYLRSTGFALQIERPKSVPLATQATTFDLTKTVKEMEKCIPVVDQVQSLLKIDGNTVSQRQLICRNIEGNSCNSPKVIRFLLLGFIHETAQQFPCHMQVCRFEQSTTEKEVEDCLERIKAFPERAFVLVAVDKLKPKASKLVNDIQKQELIRSQATDGSASLCCLYFSALDDPRCLNGKLRDDDKEMWQSLKTSWNNMKTLDCRPQVEIVCGLPLTGKTTFILNKKRDKEPIIIYIADSVDVQTIIQQLNSTSELQDIILTISSFAPLDDVNELLLNLLVFGCLCSDQSGICFAWPSEYAGKLVIELSCLKSKGSDEPWHGMTETLIDKLSVAAVAATDIFIMVDSATVPSDVEVPETLPTDDFKVQIVINKFSHDHVTKDKLDLCRQYLEEDGDDQSEKDESLVIDALVLDNAIHVSNAARASPTKYRYVRQYTSKFQWIDRADIKVKSCFELDLKDHVFREADYLCKPKLDCSQLKEYVSFLVPCKERKFAYLIGNVLSPGRALREIAASGSSALKAIDKDKRGTTIIAAMFELEVKVVEDLLSRKDFILTDDIAYKMVLLHHRKLSGIPVIVEGETGVGKTYLLNMYAHLLNARHDPDLAFQVSCWIREEALLEWEDEDLVGKDSKKDLKKKLGGKLYDKEAVITLFRSVLEALPKENTTALCRVNNSLKQRIRQWYNSIHLLKNMPAPVSRLLEYQDEPSVEKTVQLLGEFLKTPVQSLFEKLLLHPGISQQDIRDFVVRVACAARNKDFITFVIFFDEINTSTCLGTLKEIVCDHRMDGTELPKNIFFTAAMNPFTGMVAEHDAESDFLDMTRGTRSIPVHRHIYHVLRLPESMEDYVWIYRGMKNDTMKKYLREKTTAALNYIASTSQEMENPTEKPAQSERSSIENELLSCGRLVYAAHNFCLTMLGEGSVSQRDVKRVFELVKFFWKYLPAFWDVYGQKVEDPNCRAQLAVQLSVGIVYYFRLSQEIEEESVSTSRSAFAVEINRVVRTQYTIEYAMDSAIKRFVTRQHFTFPKGIALTKALSENIFTIVACVVSKVPLGIIGIPGSSKTLSVHIVRDNLRGPEQSHKEFCKKFPAVDVFSHQCSEYSTSEEIQKTFETAIPRQQFYDRTSKRCCLVFLDEAGLPKEKLMVLKVLHPFLDDPLVSFVAISNFPFDAANTNRMVILRRSLDKEDLEVLAKGCLGIGDCEETTKVYQFAKGLCQGFRRVLKDEYFKAMFHYRDFIYTLKYLRWNSQRSTVAGGPFTVPRAEDVLHALEENMNGKEEQEFLRLVDVFFEGLQEVVGRDFGVPSGTRPRPQMEILQGMLNPQTSPSEDKFVSRFVMIVDPAKDETAFIRMLLDSGLLGRGNEERRIKLLTLSDFEEDDTPLKNTETLAHMRYALKDLCTVVLQNSSRINSALYDLFNQTFNIMANNRDGREKSVYANLAVGEFTYPCEVNPGFKCVVIIRERDLLATAPPFLSRFSKFRLSAKDFYDFHVKEIVDPTRRSHITSIKQTVTKFLDQIGQDVLFGIIDKETAVSQLLVTHIRENEIKTKQKAFGQRVLDDRIEICLSESRSNFDLSLAAICARLLQLAPPEVLILSLARVNKLWRNFFAQVYFEVHEHFSVEKLITALGTANSTHTGNTKVSGSKVLLYCRCTKAVQDLCEDYERLHGDWLIYNVSKIQSSSEVSDFLLKFTEATRRDVALLVVPPPLSAQFKQVRLILQLVDDAYQYCNTGQTRGILDLSSDRYQPDVMKHKTFVVMLPHHPDAESAGTVHPAQFLDGWTTFFLDLSESEYSAVALNVSLRLQCAEFAKQHDDLCVDADTANLFREWLSEEGASLFCRGHRIPPVHEDFLKLFNPATRQIYSMKSTFEEQIAAVQQLTDLPWLIEVVMTIFSSSASVGKSIQVLLKGLALEVFAKRQTESISALTHVHLKKLFLIYFSHFLAQVSANFGLSTILDWISNSDSENSAKDLKNVLQASCEESNIPLLRHLPISVYLDTYIPYRTPLFHQLMGLRTLLASEKSDYIEEDSIGYLQSRIQEIPVAAVMSRVIGRSLDRLSGWILDLIQLVVSCNTTVVVTKDILIPAESFISMKLNTSEDNRASQFVNAFLVVERNRGNVIGIVRGCIALDQLGMLSGNDFRVGSSRNFEKSFWIQTLSLLNDNLGAEGLDQEQWTSSVSLIIPLFTMLLSFKSKRLKSRMALLLLLHGLVRAGIDPTEILRIKHESTGQSSFYLGSVLRRFTALATTSRWLSVQKNFEIALREVLFSYAPHLSYAEGTSVDVECGISVERGAKSISVSLPDDRILKMLIQDGKVSSTVSTTASVSKFTSKDLESVSIPETFPVLSVVRRLLPALKCLREVFLSVASLHWWMYKELPLYTMSVDETVNDAIRHFRNECLSEGRKRILDPMEAIQQAVRIVSSDFSSAQTQELFSLTLEECLKTSSDRGEGILFELLCQLAQIQLEVIEVLRRYLQGDQAGRYWTMVFKGPALYQPVSLSQILNTEGLSLIYIDENQFLCLSQSCLTDDKPHIDLSRLERLVIETFLGNVREIDIESLRPTTTFVPLGHYVNRLAAQGEEKQDDLESQTFIDLWLTRPEKLPEPAEPKMKASVEECCENFDQTDAEDCLRVQPYKEARVLLQEYARVIDQHPDQPMPETLKQYMKSDCKLGGLLLRSIDEIGRYREHVLRRILRYESGIRAEEYQKSSKNKQLWPEQSNMSRLQGGGISHGHSKFSFQHWNRYPKMVDLRVALPRSIASEDESEEANSNVDSPCSDSEETDPVIDGPSCEATSEDEEEPMDVNLPQLVREHALNLWKEEECAAQATIQYSVVIETPQASKIVMQDLREDEELSEFIVLSGLREDTALIPRTFCTRSDVEGLVNQALSNASALVPSSQQSCLSNHVGLILAKTERPFDASSFRSELFLIRKTLEIVICLQIWKEDCDPLDNETFFTINRHFAVEATIEDLLAAAVWHAMQNNQVSSAGVLHYENGIIIVNSTTVADLQLPNDRVPSLFCSFGCPYVFRCVDNEGEEFSVLPACFKRYVLSRKIAPVQVAQEDEIGEEFLVWNNKKGDMDTELQSYKKFDTFVIPWRAVFPVSVAVEGANLKNEILPVLHTTSPQSICSYSESLISKEISGTSSERPCQKTLKRRISKSARAQVQNGYLLLKRVPVGWSCSSGTRLECETQWLGKRILIVQRHLQLAPGDHKVAESAVEVDWGKCTSVLDLLDLVKGEQPLDDSDKRDESNLHWLVDVVSHVVLEENEQSNVLIASLALERNPVALVLRNSVFDCNLPIFGYHFKSGGRKRYGNEQFRFAGLPVEDVSWEHVRHFLALRHSAKGEGKSPYHCALPPFLTFVDCNVVIDSYSNFFKLVQKEIGLSIGFWEVLKPERLIQIEINFEDSKTLHCEISTDSANQMTIRNLLRLLSKIEDQTTYQCCLTGECGNLLNQSCTLFEVLENRESIKLKFASLDTVDVRILFESETTPVKIDTCCSIKDAMVAFLSALSLNAAPDLFTLQAVNHDLLLSPNSESPFFKTLEDEGFDPEEDKFALVSVVDSIWVGIQGFMELQKLDHPSYSKISAFRNEAARLLGFDPEKYRLALGDDIPVRSLNSRLDKILRVCYAQGFLHEGKPVIRFAEISRPSVATQLELCEESSTLHRIVPRCAPDLWHRDEYDLLSEDVDYPVVVRDYELCIPMEDLIVDDKKKKRFTIDVFGDQTSCKRRFCCLRSMLESQVKEDFRRSGKELEKFCLTNRQGLVLRGHETPTSHKFTVLPVQKTCAVRIRFRNLVVSELEGTDWDYSTLFRGDGVVTDESQCVSVLERNVLLTATVEQLAKIAIWFWYTDTNVKRDDVVIRCDGGIVGIPVVIHYDDGNVPDLTEMVSNLREQTLWCSVGCKQSIVLADGSAVVPDHFPLRRLQDFQLTTRQGNVQNILEEYFVWPSCRMLISARSSSVSVLPRSSRAVYPLTVKNDSGEQVLPVMPTTTCRSLLDYLSKDGGLTGRLAVEYVTESESDAKQCRLLPPSLPVGHIASSNASVVLYHVTSPLYVNVSIPKRDNTFTRKIAKAMTVDDLHRELSKQERLVEAHYCCIDAVTRCQLPNTVTIKKEEVPLTMTSLNVPGIEFCEKDLVAVSMQAFCYWKSGPTSVGRSKYSHDVTFSVQKPSSERKVSWELLATFLGSTTWFPGPNPFNSAIRPFLIMMNVDSGGSVMMPNPELNVTKFLDIAKLSQYKLAIGYWKSYEEGPLMNITVQRYHPRVWMKFQAEHQTDITIRDVAQAVSLQVAESQCRCILVRQGTECTRDTRLSDLARRGAPDVCLTLSILDEMEVDIRFEQEKHYRRVTVNISDRSEQLIKQYLVEFHPNAKPNLFQLNDEETNSPLNQGVTFEDLLNSSGKDPGSRMKFVLRPVSETFEITVEVSGQKQVVSVCHPLFSTIKEFVDNIATELSKELERNVRSDEINLYATCGQNEEKVQIDDQRLDELIEEMKKGVRGIKNSKVEFTAVLL
jgi:hypothetical protein